MIQTVLGVFLILLHIVCCVLVWLGIKTHLLKVKKYLMALVIFVPFWGTVCVLLLHLQMLTRRDNRIEPGVEKLRVNEEIYKNEEIKLLLYALGIDINSYNPNKLRYGKIAICVDPDR